MISSLTSFLKKDSCFPLNEAALSQFHQLKETLTTTPILSHFNPSLPTIVETDASNYALSAVLSQVSDSGKHPITFNSPKPIPAELNYEIHDKELLGIVWAHKRWRAFLPLKFSPIILPSNTSSTLPDALSHWDDVYPERGEDFISKNPTNFQQLINQDEVQPSRYFAVKGESFSNFIDSIQKALWQDYQYRSILQELSKGKSIHNYSLDSSSQLLLFKYQVVVPNDPTIELRILQKRHDSSLAGHPGQEKTLKLVKWDFHWYGMTQFIKDYVSPCQQCSKNKNIHHKKFGLLKPLPITNGPWICLSMDFSTQLPLSNPFDSILVMVDRFSKMAVFIPTMFSITSLDLAHLFIKNIFSKHGLPSSILKISTDLSTAYHPETDGQTERVNQILEQYLRMYVSYHQDYWNTWLPLAEFAYNNSDHSSTTQSPVFTVYGRDPPFDSVHITKDTPAGRLSTKIQSVQKDFKRELEVAINQFKRYADKSRASPPVFNAGDMVWLSSKNIKSVRPTKKLSERWLDPFPILKKVSTHAYHLKLPSQ
ncbi:hypothetical protein O181_042074 [Austropuccinia psidii MF-1]|uniref:Integrase catalytic domain-containing protein n=1 Tax=Austropuccinia psidii MF-1 TaxID=1389203 RepID=A0A9Q3HH44_9BASI|nr:hypothetical protein [Austropuccinia psidii MF-1]